MGRKLNKLLSVLTLIGVTLSVTVACQRTDATIEIERNTQKRFYSIDSESILESLAQGNLDIFTLLSATPEHEIVSSTNTSWTQAEYFRIAQAIHEHSWEEPLGHQNLFSSSFTMNCLHIEKGTFTEASFDSVEVVQSGGEETRIEHWITIKPANNLISTTKLEYQPSARIKKPIDLEGYRITAEQAAQIADGNGGYEARMAVGNECEITTFTPTVNGGGWEVNYVTYSDKSAKSLYSIAIDPQTGNFEVLYSTP